MEEAQEQPATQPGPQPRRWWTRLLAESVFIVIAVLVALAVDEWWEELENEELADRALSAIVEEIRRNRAELEPSSSTAPYDQQMLALQQALDAYGEGRTPDGLGVTWDVGVLSSAAWSTAQVTRATQFLPIRQVVDIAQLYELQAQYAARQDALVALISELDAHMAEDPERALKILRGRFGLALQLHGAMANGYACALVELGVADDHETDDCNAPR